MSDFMKQLGFMVLGTFALYATWYFIWKVLKFSDTAIILLAVASTATLVIVYGSRDRL